MEYRFDMTGFLQIFIQKQISLSSTRVTVTPPSISRTVLDIRLVPRLERLPFPTFSVRSCSILSEPPSTCAFRDNMCLNDLELFNPDMCFGMNTVRNCIHTFPSRRLTHVFMDWHSKTQKQP